MRFSRWFALCGGLLVLVTVSFLSGVHYSKQVEVQASNAGNYPGGLPGELFIKDHMINTNQTLKTNMKHVAANNKNIAQGMQSLSESLGLWMMYALEKRDRQLFALNVDVLNKHFDQDGWIAWKIGDQAHAVSTNALIDDLRIAEALYRAGEAWKVDSYIKLANEIGDSVIKHQVNGGQFVDFYDRKAKYASDVLTLSYLSGGAFAKMYEHQRIKEDMYKKTISFLESIPTKNGFFPFAYSLTSKSYDYHKDVNLIDQLYIAYHRAQAGIASPQLWAFLKAEFSRDGLLYGKYDSGTKKPTVTFESPAVYGLAILTAVELHDTEFARDLYVRMIHKQIRKPESPYYGGYVDTNTMDTHIFDNLVPLLAERKLFNEGILQ